MKDFTMIALQPILNHNFGVLRQETKIKFTEADSNKSIADCRRRNLNLNKRKPCSINLTKLIRVNHSEKPTE